MMNYLHYTSGSPSILQTLIDNNADRQYRLANEISSNRTYLFDVTGNRESNFASPISYQVLEHYHDDKLSGIVHIESYNDDIKKREALLETARQIFDKTRVAALSAAFIMQDLKDSNHIILITCWESEAALQEWLNSKVYQPLRSFSNRDPQNSFYHQDFRILN